MAATFRCNNNKNLIISNQVSNHFLITLGSTTEGYTTVTIPKEEFMQAVIVLANEMYIEKEEGEETNE
mgnify:FL=1